MVKYIVLDNEDEEDIDMIGQNIRTLRKQHNMTQAQLSEKANVSIVHISHVENGTSSISLPLLLDLCTVFGVTPNDILAGEFKPKEHPSEYLSDKTLHLKDIDLNDRILLDHIYNFMIERNSRDITD